jgi:hypothetical protein
MVGTGNEQSEAREGTDSPHLRRPAVIVDLCDAAAFIDMHGERTRPWVAAETAVKRADRNACLIRQATETLENALRREGMLD